MCNAQRLDSGHSAKLPGNNVAYTSTIVRAIMATLVPQAIALKVGELTCSPEQVTPAGEQVQKDRHDGSKPLATCEKTRISVAARSE